MVTIEDFEMPESCEDCPLKTKGALGDTFCIFKSVLIPVDDLFLVRHDMCPLREVKGE